jgi:hypothetical protein
MTASSTPTPAARREIALDPEGQLVVELVRQGVPPPDEISPAAAASEQEPT